MIAYGKEMAATAESERFDYTVERYYYTPEKRFEQSLDFYRPVVHCANQLSQLPPPRRVPVVLVMGSGWLGHKPYFYLITNWWNSSAPKQICGGLGHPCVSIRHSGGYPFGRITAPTLSFGMWMPVTIAVGMIAVAMNLAWISPQQILPLLVLVVLVNKDGLGAAGIDDMVKDVSIALEFIDQHALEWNLGGVDSALASTNSASKRFKNAIIPIVFGGYSSGAHVAATLLTYSSFSPLVGLARNSSSLSPQPQRRKQQLDHIAISSVLYISGVLDVSSDSFVMTALSNVVLGEAPLEVPSPLRTLRYLADNTGASNNESSSTNPIPTAESLPPHILIGCKREVFGWSILDSAFCASEYADALRSFRSGAQLSPYTQSTSNGMNGNGNNAKLQKSKIAYDQVVLLQGITANHWSILSSRALRESLRTLLVSEAQQACILSNNEVVENDRG